MATMGRYQRPRSRTWGRKARRTSLFSKTISLSGSTRRNRSTKVRPKRGDDGLTLAVMSRSAELRVQISSYLLAGESPARVKAKPSARVFDPESSA